MNAWWMLEHGRDDDGELTDGLVSISSSRFNEDIPEIRLIVAVIIQAGLDHDDDYFSSTTFKSHCIAIRLQEQTIRKLVYKIWSEE